MCDNTDLFAYCPWRPQLDDEIPRYTLRLGLAALFFPEPDEGRLVGAHDDPCVGTSDELTAVRLCRGWNRDKVVESDLHAILLRLADYLDAV
jgi:hypothetical protein